MSGTVGEARKQILCLSNIQSFLPGCLADGMRLSGKAMCKWRHPGCMARQGHFLGNYTVLDILRQEGYEVEHTPSGQPITEKPYPSAGSPSETELPPLRHPLGTGFPDATHPEEELLTPHLLLPDSLNQLEEFGRQKKRPKKQQRQQGRQRQFNDLWVRMEDSTIQLPNIRTTKGYITVEPPLTSQEQQRRTEAHNLHPPRWDPTSPSSPAPPVIPPQAAVVCLLAVLLPRLLQPS